MQEENIVKKRIQRKIISKQELSVNAILHDGNQICNIITENVSKHREIRLIRSWEFVFTNVYKMH